MMSQNKIFNNIKHSPNMWMPKVKLFNKPKLPTFTILPKKDLVLTKHACRLKAIDMLLFTQDIQKRYRRERFMRLRKYTCARCVPRKRNNLLEQLVFQEPVRGNDKICINFTFSKNNKDAQFEHDITNFSQVNTCVSYTKISYEEGIVNVVDSPESPKSIRLKLQKATSGQYCSSIMS